MTEFSQAFDIETLLKEENDLIEKIDDTKLLVDGVEIKSSEPFKVNFEELENIPNQKMSDDEEEEEDDDEIFELNDDSEENVEIEDLNLEKAHNPNKVTFKSDVVLNTKKLRKIRAEEEKKSRENTAIAMGVARIKQTTNRIDMRKKIFEDKEDIEKQIYKSENIPRTKKLQKIEMKKQIKKLKKNGKVF